MVGLLDGNSLGDAETDGSELGCDDGLLETEGTTEVLGLFVVLGDSDTDGSALIVGTTDKEGTAVVPGGGFLVGRSVKKASVGRDDGSVDKEGFKDGKLTGRCVITLLSLVGLLVIGMLLEGSWDGTLSGEQVGLLSGS